MAERVIIFTDGAAKGNPGPGGWGAILCDGDTVTELGGSSPSTTNNRMEMEAAIRALQHLGKAAAPITVFTDSTYLIHGITKWIHGWRRRDWKTAQGGDVLNRDLWERLDSLAHAAAAKVSWTYVPGHAGIPGNERADTIASELALGHPVDLYRGARGGYAVDLTPPGGAGRSASQPTGTTRKARSGKAYSYLSLVGGVAERHRTWAECERRVRGVSGARFKKAVSAEDEALILAAWGAHLPAAG